MNEIASGGPAFPISDDVAVESYKYADALRIIKILLEDSECYCPNPEESLGRGPCAFCEAKEFLSKIRAGKGEQMSEIEPFAIIRGPYLIVGGEPVAYADAPFERIGLNESMKRINVAFEKAVSRRAKNAQKKIPRSDKGAK